VEYIYSPTNVQFNHNNCVISLSYMFRTPNLGSFQGLIISNHTQFAPTRTIVYIVKHELFTIVHIHCLKQIKREYCSCWESLTLIKTF
jgi:hypothetical protein